MCRRHQIQHYTGQLAKDTNKTLRDLANLSLPISEQVDYNLVLTILQFTYINCCSEF